MFIYIRKTFHIVNDYAAHMLICVITKITYKELKIRLDINFSINIESMQIIKWYLHKIYCREVIFMLLCRICTYTSKRTVAAWIELNMKLLLLSLNMLLMPTLSAWILWKNFQKINLYVVQYYFLVINHERSKPLFLIVKF